MGNQRPEKPRHQVEAVLGTMVFSTCCLHRMFILTWSPKLPKIFTDFHPPNKKNHLLSGIGISLLDVHSLSRCVYVPNWMGFSWETRRAPVLWSLSTSAHAFLCCPPSPSAGSWPRKQADGFLLTKMSRVLTPILTKKYKKRKQDPSFFVPLTKQTQTEWCQFDYNQTHPPSLPTLNPLCNFNPIWPRSKGTVLMATRMPVGLCTPAWTWDRRVILGPTGPWIAQLFVGYVINVINHQDFTGWCWFTHPLSGKGINSDCLNVLLYICIDSYILYICIFFCACTDRLYELLDSCSCKRNDALDCNKSFETLQPLGVQHHEQKIDKNSLNCYPPIPRILARPPV